MASFFSSLNPTPAFPTYSGPYSVGSIDVEIPVSELSPTSPTPDPIITTVQFRLFYPCEKACRPTKHVYWIPDPQHAYLSAYIKFLGASSRLSQLIAYFPRLLYHITLPVRRDAKILPPLTTSKRWPLLVFSHGLGGSRNAYSFLLGSLASYGIVVIAPEHRDGSGVITYINRGNGSKPSWIDYQNISHTLSPEVEEARDRQLRIRLWELELIHEAALKIDLGHSFTNVASENTLNKSGSRSELHMFASALDIHRPGAIAWAGHSFGATTVYQFMKSVYYRPSKPTMDHYQPLLSPDDSSPIVRQITSSSSIILLDLWTLPLRSTATDWLWTKPLPCYTLGGAGGASVLAILSESFFKWRGNLISTKSAVSAGPAGDRRHDPGQVHPYIFYPVKTAHFSQSDFGILFSWAGKKLLKAEEPVRTLTLNIVAIVEFLRQNGMDVPHITELDRLAVIEKEPVERQADKHAVGKAAHKLHEQLNGAAPRHLNGTADKSEESQFDILSKPGSIRGWISVNVEEEDQPGEATNLKTSADAQPSEAVMETELMDGQEGEAEKL